MDWITTVAVFVLVFVSYAIGRLSSDATPIKRENERLNAELKKLTDRDERGRFKGGK
jgi:hypothetical protein